MNFQNRLIKSINEKHSVLVVGLDPNISLFPEFLVKNIHNNDEKTAAILEFNKLVIDVVHNKCIAVKPQLAYYEIFGSKGIKVLEETIKYAQNKGLIVILDAKRGDIGSTCEFYAEAFLGSSPISADAVTVNPYLGRDSILPFVKKAADNDKGIFVLTKTSNPSSNDLQNIKTSDNEEIYIKVAKLMKQIISQEAEYSNIGVVVGATYPAEAEQIRKIVKSSFFLVPGYGAQGARGKDLINYYDNYGLGALISASRSITYPYLNQNIDRKTISKQLLEKMINDAVDKANDDINRFRPNK